MSDKIEWTRINNDANGNPRYVCHFLNIIPDIDYTTGLSLSERYEIAIKRANKIGGHKFHNKQYGGGIVFQSYSLNDTERHIDSIIKECLK
jgi:hypothetical protein